MCKIKCILCVEEQSHTTHYRKSSTSDSLVSIKMSTRLGWLVTSITLSTSQQMDFIIVVDGYWEEQQLHLSHYF